MNEHLFEDNAKFTREEWEEMGRCEGASPELIEQTWEQNQDTTKGELSKRGFERLTHEVMRENMLPGFHDYDEDEFFGVWKFFKAEAVRIAAEMKGQSARDVVKAVLARYQVLGHRTASVAAYAVYALDCEEGSMKDQLPELALLVLGSRTREAESEH
ncbi:MAG: hypothetical protein ABJB97_08160 [Acidobacteriota bacterium]